MICGCRQNLAVVSEQVVPQGRKQKKYLKTLKIDPVGVNTPLQLRYDTAHCHMLGPDFERPDLSQTTKPGHV